MALSGNLWENSRSQPTRRQLLQVGGLGMVGLSLPQLLEARAPALDAARPRGRARSCIFVVQYGGASHIDTWDPKPDAIAEIRGPYRPIATSVPGIRMGELLPRLARLASARPRAQSFSHGQRGDLQSLQNHSGCPC